MSETAVAEAITETLLTATPTSVETPTSETPDAPATAPVAAEAAPVAAPVYAFVPPDGVTYDETLIASALPIFTEANVAPDVAQKLVSLVADRVAAVEAARTEGIAAQVAQWEAEVKADPDMGGAKLAGTIASAQRAIHRFGGAEAVRLIGPLGSHPLVVKLFAAVGAATSEDTTIKTSSGGAPAVTNPGAVLFPSMQAKE